MAKPRTTRNSGLIRKLYQSTRLNVRIVIAIAFGFLIGSFFPLPAISSVQVISTVSSTEGKNTRILSRIIPKCARNSTDDQVRISLLSSNDTEIYVPSNPRGARSLPTGIVASESDFHLHRLWGDWKKDQQNIPKYLVTFTVGYEQKRNIDAAVKKFSGNFTILLFHYDGRVNEWDEFEWSKQAIHISARKQTKWWYAKRFLHPAIVDCYEYIFIWDEDLGLEHFDAEKYIELVKKHGLEISQPGVQSERKILWQLTKKRNNSEVHKVSEEISGRCSDPLLPPCAAFVEIMAPVFSRDAWQCVWHLIQNDLVHGWGLDFAFRYCVKPAQEKIGVVDSQWIVHQGIPSLRNQGEGGDGQKPSHKVKDRCFSEWEAFHARMEHAVQAYYKEKGIAVPTKYKSFLIKRNKSTAYDGDRR